MKKHFTCTTITFVLLFVFCSSYAQSLSTVKAEIQKINLRYFDLFRNKDTAIVNLYTNDGCLMAPNAPAIRGKAALSKDFKDTYAAGQIMGVKFSTTGVFGSGEYVSEEGTWQVFNVNGKVIDNGKYLKLWKKEKHGWKIFRDIFNSDQKSS